MTRPPASDDALVPDALALGAATLGESGARRMHSRVKPAWSGARVAGPAYPVRCSPGDNLAIHVAVTRAPAGSILVADMGGEREYGYWGEVLTTGAEARGIAGLVIDACVRDCDALAAHGFPVFSTGLALTGASKTQPGSVDRAVTGTRAPSASGADSSMRARGSSPFDRQRIGDTPKAGEGRGR